MQSEEQFNNLKISIIGLGLIGGSIARGLRRNRPGITIQALDKPEICKKALADHVIDIELNSLEEAVNSDIIFLCLPLNLSLSSFEKIIPLLNENTIITDVCGVKGIFEEKWNSIGSKGIYIGGHPMTGKEKGGYENSDYMLFENAVYIISNKASASVNHKGFLSLLESLGARVIFLDPFVHDAVVSKVSHLPQLLSVALVNTAAKNGGGINNLDFAAGGFRDMTRIASSDFSIWKSVLNINKEQIISSLELFQKEITNIIDSLKGDSIDELETMFNSARVSRDEIPKNTKGFISPLYDLFVYVKDKPGEIYKIATALYQRSINIKDIEIMKIREGSGGALRIAFDSELDAIEAKKILIGIGFEVN